jgi:hypothetical protein
MNEPGSTRTDTLAAIGVVMLIAGLIISSLAIIANSMMVVGVACLTPSMWRARTRLPAVIAAATVFGWVVSGIFIGSTPEWGRPNEVLDWISEDARFIVTVAVLIGMIGIADAARHRQAVGLAVTGIAASGAAMLALYPFVATVRNEADLLVGLTSSHHVIAALGGFGILAGFSIREIWPTERWRWAATAAMLATVALSGSRAVLIGLTVALVVMAMMQRRTAGYRSTAVLIVVVLAVGVLAVPRVRETVLWLIPGTGSDLDVTDQGSEQVDAESEPIASGDLDEPDQGSEQVDAEGEPKAPGQEPTPASIQNIEDRLAYWERAADWILASPMVGGGAFRFNDSEETFSGIRGVVYVATDGERRFNAAQAHNVYLHVAAETGLIGALAFFAPWAWACVVLARRKPTGNPEQRDPSTVALDEVREFAVSMLVLAGVVGLFSEGVFAPSLGIVTAVAAIGGARLWERAG